MTLLFNMIEECMTFTPLPYTSEEIAKAILVAGECTAIISYSDAYNSMLNFINMNIGIESTDICNWQTLYKLAEYDSLTIFIMHDKKQKYMSVTPLSEPHSTVFWGTFSHDRT